MSDEKIYEQFIDWVDHTWWQLTESEHLMPLIKTNYTPEEAELLTGMSFSAKTIEELATLKNTDPETLALKRYERSTPFNKGKELIKTIALENRE
jgi:hypothetical protein